MSLKQTSAVILLPGALLAHMLAPGFSGLQLPTVQGTVLNLIAPRVIGLSAAPGAPAPTALNSASSEAFANIAPGRDMPPAPQTLPVRLRASDPVQNGDAAELSLPGGGMPAAPDELGFAMSRMERGEMFVRLASRYLGLAYLYGGSRPQTGFDCSGFTGYVYNKFGIDLPRSAHAQSVSRALKSTQAPVPGDLVFFKINKRRVSHVGMYVGEDLFIHSPRTGKSIEYGNLKLKYWRTRFAGARTPKN